MTCYDAGLVKPRFLEIGSARIEGTPNLCDVAKKVGIGDCVGVDLAATDGADLAIDFALSDGSEIGKFATVCIFNVLEHTFDPFKVLANAASRVDIGGALLVVVPSVWPIHNYPGDYTRLLPQWYREFAKRMGLELVDSKFCWLSEFGIDPIARNETLPTYLSRRAQASTIRYWISRIVHKLANTYGRSHWATHCAIGAAFLRRAFPQ